MWTIAWCRSPSSPQVDLGQPLVQLDRVLAGQPARQLAIEQAAQLAPLLGLGVEAIEGGVGLLVARLEG